MRDFLQSRLVAFVYFLCNFKTKYLCGSELLKELLAQIEFEILKRCMATDD